MQTMQIYFGFLPFFRIFSSNLMCKLFSHTNFLLRIWKQATSFLAEQVLNWVFNQAQLSLDYLLFFRPDGCNGRWGKQEVPFIRNGGFIADLIIALALGGDIALCRSVWLSLPSYFYLEVKFLAVWLFQTEIFGCNGRWKQEVPFIMNGASITNFIIRINALGGDIALPS